MPSHIYNKGWYADNELQQFPIDALASAVDDAGVEFPDGIIVDCRITYPAVVGTDCYISGVMITDSLFTLVLSSGDTPIASLAVRQPIKAYYHYTLEELSDGVGGILVLSEYARYARGAWRFSSPTQSRLSPDCVNTYESIPVSSIGVLNAGNGYSGDIKLEAGSDITMQLRHSDELGVDAIFIGLDVSGDKQAMLKKYLSACDTRVESSTCKLDSVLLFGGATPTCGGAITIVGDGIEVSTVDNMVVLDYGKTLPEVCPSFTIGDNVGKKQCCEDTGFTVSNAVASVSLAASAIYEDPFANESTFTIVSGGVSRTVSADNVSYWGNVEGSPVVLNISEPNSIITFEVTSTGSTYIRDGSLTIHTNNGRVTYGSAIQLLTTEAATLVVQLDSGSTNPITSVGGEGIPYAINTSSLQLELDGSIIHNFLISRR